MKHFTRLKTLLSGAALSVVLLASSVGSAYATPTAKETTPPNGAPAVSGKQDKPAVAPGSVDAKATEKLGETQQIKTDKTGKPEASANSITPQAGNVAGVDFQAPYNYCWKNFVYTPITNTTTSTKYARVLLYNQGMYRDIYVTISAGSTAYPGFYGVEGSYYAYLYVWNGSSYVYDEYRSSSNTCNVQVSRVYNTGGWVQLKIQNYGTAYATQVSSELAPFPGAGTYTGTQYDYPAAGGAAIYRWFYVGTSPYGITSYTSGSWNTPYTFYGDL